MPSRAASLAPAVLALACSSAAGPPGSTGQERGAGVISPVVDATPPPSPVKVRIQVVSASIDGRSADGREWDEGPAKAPAVGGPLGAYLHEHPELAGAEAWIGHHALVPAIAEEARSAAADPMAFVEIAGRTFRTPMIPRTFQPLWSFPLVALLPAERQGLVARVTVVDWDGPDRHDVIGTTVIPVEELLARRAHELPRFGNVARLLLEVEPVPPAPSPRERRLAVPGRPIWTDSGVEVVAGEEITVLASGQVCTWGQKHCDYPDGQTNVFEYNLPGFERRPHGALVGAISDTRFLLGRERTFVAPSSGRLFLGVNDRDDSDNTGAFDVHVTVR